MLVNLSKQMRTTKKCFSRKIFIEIVVMIFNLYHISITDFEMGF